MLTSGKLLVRYTREIFKKQLSKTCPQNYLLQNKMKIKPRHTIVILPDNSHIEVSYFCTDQNIPAKQKENSTDLVIQLHDCHYPLRILRSIEKNAELLEQIVHKTVINARGHLC